MWRLFAAAAAAAAPSAPCTPGAAPSAAAAIASASIVTGTIAAGANASLIRVQRRSRRKASFVGYMCRAMFASAFYGVPCYHGEQRHDTHGKATLRGLARMGLVVWV
jgi:hypothetical protein